jgi:hypothetical protein
MTISSPASFPLLRAAIPLFIANTVSAGSPGKMPHTADSNPEISILEKFMRPALDLRYTYDEDMDFSDQPGSISLQEAEILVPLPQIHSDNFCLLADLYYRYYQLDAASSGWTGELNLHTVRVPLQMVWKSTDSPWFLYALLQPGVSSDFNSFSSETFDLTASINLGYRFSPDLVVAGGVYYTRDYGDDIVLPSVGILWSPIDKLSFLLSAAGAVLTYECSDDWRLKLKALPYGGRWIVDHNSDRERIELAGGKVGIDLERRIAKQAWISLGVGANVFTNLRVEDDRGRALVDQDLDPSLYVTGGLRWTF